MSASHPALHLPEGSCQLATSANGDCHYFSILVQIVEAIISKRPTRFFQDADVWRGTNRQTAQPKPLQPLAAIQTLLFVH